ncbi:organic hydroperoxide resistance protein [Bacillaceae bacterium SIJ1]|uniref:organic hydroperoxide resistance protein n=1 Tax=Litoribacterium kuwaitense TaxID=1398745 RepID=UPI0013ED9CB6|nr:organic hydroperoxide resistance protein [Litoribacterium kuwaitense]NGP46304.1 organic hydroperoxide resistance protein [Litoribacterium kuwaitense]
MKPLYTATATSQGGRDGHVRSSDGIINLDVSMPKELGGPGKEATNPEQLFAAGYAACFESAFRLVARKKKVTVPEDAKITAHATIGEDERDGGFKLAVKLEASVPGLADETVNELLQAAHEVCPYSKATSGNIDVELVTK